MVIGVLPGVKHKPPAEADEEQLVRRTARGDRAAFEEFYRRTSPWLAVRRAGIDPEGDLRAVAKQLTRDIRAAGAAARAEGVEPTTLETGGWRKFWLSA